jgi:LIVCS family branched-chain amino acid:cation transporter
LAIVLILLTLSSSFFKHKQGVYAASMLLTFCVSFFDGYSTLVGSLPGATIPLFESIKAAYIEYLPLYSIGLGWILPAVVGAIIGYFLPTESKKAAIQ